MSRIVQGSILAALVVIAGLLVNISMKMSVPLAAPVPEPVAAPVAQPQLVQPAPAAPAPMTTRTAPPTRPAASRSATVAASSSTAPPPPPPPPANGGFRLPDSQGSPGQDAGSIPRPADSGPYVVYGSSGSMPPPPPPPPSSRTVTIPAGTPFAVRLLDRLSSERNRHGDIFAASLDEGLVVDGVTVAHRGAAVSGRVVESRESGRIAGRAEMVIEVDRLQTVSGEIQIASDSMIRTADSSVKQDVAKAGIITGIGAAIGAIAGGRKGAGIGAAAGGTAGTVGVIASKGKPVEFEPEARLTFRFKAPVTLPADGSSGGPSSLDNHRPSLRRRP